MKNNEVGVKMGKNNTSLVVENLAKKVAKDLGYEIWDVRFVKEGATWYLRIFIDSDKGIEIEDCERMSRAIDGPLDELDPIKVPYYLEVCSPGLERELIKDEHFQKYLNERVKVKLIRPDEKGNEEISGKLVSFVDNIIEIETKGETLKVNKKDTSYVKLDDFENEWSFLKRKE